MVPFLELMTKSGHLHGRPFMGLEELPFQLTQAFALFSLPAGPPTLPGTKCSREAGGAFPGSGAALSPQRTPPRISNARRALSGGSLRLLPRSQPAASFRSILPWGARALQAFIEMVSRWFAQGLECSRSPRAACGDVKQKPRLRVVAPTPRAPGLGPIPATGKAYA